MRQGAEVFIASSGSAGVLLKKEFPNLSYMELPGYAPVYPVRSSMIIKMIGQLPKFFRAVRQENETVKVLVLKHRIDIVISDNRYGCYSAHARSIFITHQLNVMLPPGWTAFGQLINSLCHRYIRKFQEVWVPDQRGSGLTTSFHSDRFPAVKFVGWLSRFGGTQAPNKKYDVAVVISGPEPQRSMFAAICLAQLKKSSSKALLVLGEPGKNVNQADGRVQVVSHLPSKELEEALINSEVVVARSGYSTVMDLIALGKKAIFVPTPFQPEQIFFARHLMASGIAFSVQQDQFVLEIALERMRAFSGLSVYSMEKGLLEGEIKNLLT